MKAKKADASGEARWWKLNTLRYGGRLLGASGVLALASLCLYFTGLQAPARLALTAAAALSALLLILVRIELYQDKRDNERYAREDASKKGSR